MATIWGRDELVWSEIVDATIQFLEDQARLGRTPSYTEVNGAMARRTGHRAFDFGLAAERAAMGDLLGQIAQQKYRDVGALLSAITIYLNENDAGPGFYRLAAGMGLVPARASRDHRLTFWLKQVRLVHQHYRATGVA